MSMRNLFATLLLLVAATTADAILSNQNDDFEDASTMGWRDGNALSPNPPQNITSGGPSGAGDHYLQVLSNGGLGAGSKMVVLNTAQWTGDYNAAGVTGISMQVANFGLTSLNLRVGLEGGLASQYVSTNAVPVPTDGQWHPVTFSLTADEMTLIGGTSTLADLLSAVNQLRILSSALPNWHGDTIEATLGVDNIATLTPTDASPGAFPRLHLTAAPNPFNPSLTLFYSLPAEAQVRIAIYDVLGHPVRRLLVGRQGSGDHTSHWDGRSDSGRRVASGTYLVRVDAGDATVTERITLLK